MSEFLSIPGFLPLKQAALQLGLSDKRVLQYVLDSRLPARKVQGRYVIPMHALEAFQPRPHGRIRTQPVLWHKYRAGAIVWLRRIDAPIKPGCEQALSERIAAMAEAQEHTFAGTMQRYIWTGAGCLSVMLIWKSTEASQASLERAMMAFRAATADCVAWTAARDETSEVAAHT